MGQAAQGMAGAGQANPTSNPMANFGGLGAMNPAGLAAMASMGAGMPQQANAAQANAASSAPASSAAFSNPSLAAAMAQNPAAMQQMQAMYQVHSKRCILLSL